MQPVPVQQHNQPRVLCLQSGPALLLDVLASKHNAHMHQKHTCAAVITVGYCRRAGSMGSDCMADLMTSTGKIIAQYINPPRPAHASVLSICHLSRLGCPKHEFDAAHFSKMATCELNVSATSCTWQQLRACGGSLLQAAAWGEQPCKACSPWRAV